MAQIESTIETPLSNCPKIMNIPIYDIHIKENIRDKYSGIDELTESIDQHGLLQQITVYPANNGKWYYVKVGHRRFLACQKLHEADPDRFGSIPCLVSDAHNVEVIQLIENVQRVDLSARELYEVLSSLRKQGMELQQIAGVMGKTKGYTKNLFIAINEIDTNDSLKDFLDSHAGVTIQDIVETTGISDEQARLDLLKQRAEGKMNRAEMRRKVRELKQAAEGTVDKRIGLLVTMHSGEMRIMIMQENYKLCGTSPEWESVEREMTRYLQAANCPFEVTIEPKNREGGIS